MSSIFARGWLVWRLRSEAASTSARAMCVGPVVIAAEQLAQLGEREIVGDPVGHGEQHVAILGRSLPYGEVR